jgi:SAM-dependent methyltransferase
LEKKAVDGYGVDLAYIHDVGFGHFATNAAPTLLSMLRQRRMRSGLVVDLGCGSGIFGRTLCDAGYDLLGIDQSAAMIDIARTRVPNGEFRHGSLLAAKLPPCVAVTAVGECVNYLFDRSNTKRRLFGLFRRIYEALLPGGLLVLDVAGPGRVIRPGTQKLYREGKDWAVLVEIEEDRERMLLTRRITSFRKVGTLYRRDEEVHRLRLYNRSEIARQLRSCGFRVRGLQGYGPLHFPPGLFGFVARKS